MWLISFGNHFHNNMNNSIIDNKDCKMKRISLVYLIYIWLNYKN